MKVCQWNLFWNSSIQLILVQPSPMKSVLLSSFYLSPWSVCFNPRHFPIKMSSTGVQPVSCPLGNVTISLALKLLQHVDDLLTPSSAKVKNAYSFTFSSLTFLHDTVHRHRQNFTLSFWSTISGYKIMIKMLFQPQRSHSVEQDSIICKGMQVGGHSLIQGTILASPQRH
jgi:hypothetical protein